MAPHPMPKPADAKCRLARIMVVVFVLLTAAVSLVWSHAKLLSQDEMYAFQTDSLPSAAQLLHVQRVWPISLDPPLDHLLAHAAMAVFRPSAFALRLPALAGFLLMQVCLFFFVRRMAGERAGAVAAAFPALTATLFYSVEGRPYGLMLGLYALALCCWQAAARPGDPQPGDDKLQRSRQPTSSRGWSLLALAIAIAATLDAHYFGILLLAPLFAAEGWRTFERRRIDWPMATALLAGLAGLLPSLPFLKAAGEFKRHYYNAGTLSLHDISRAFRSLFVDYTRMGLPAQHLWMVALTLFALALAWGCWRAAHAPEGRASQSEWVALLVLAALPFFGYLLARFVTHSFEVRYVLGALVAISGLLGLAAAPWLRRDALFHATLIALGLGILAAGAARVRAEQRSSADRLASLVLPSDVRNALDANPDGRLYVQDMGVFEEDRFYEPDPEVESRMTLVYSAAEELRWNGHDTMALTAMHLRHFAGLPVVSYEALRAQPGEHIFAVQHSGWDWTDQAFAADGAHVRPMGHAMGGDIVAVTFQGSP